jgi:putative RNase toxin 43 of polymorphic toxin system
LSVVGGGLPTIGQLNFFIEFALPNVAIERALREGHYGGAALAAAGMVPAFRAVRAIPTWHGIGPRPGMIGVNATTTSTRGLQNFRSRGSVEYIFDPDTSTLVVNTRLHTHSPLAASIGADSDRVVGGMLTRGPGGEMITNEWSGHFWQNWSPAVRAQFNEFMQSRGFNHIHTLGGP